MGRRHPNPRLVKIHRNYTVEEIASRFALHRNTVRQWLKQGLVAIEQRRPILIHGQDLADFLRARRQRARTTCPPGHLYCVGCRAPKEPAGNMADYLPVTANSGNLRGICPTCDAFMHRRVALACIDAAKGNLDVTLPQAPEHIAACPSPSVNCDSGKDAVR